MRIAERAALAAGAPVMIMAGGTGGHIFPGLAVAAALRARGVDVCWLGASGGMETRLVPQHAIALDTIGIGSWRGKGLRVLLGAPVRLLSAIRAAARILRARRPGAAISFGGYAAGPGGLAARLGGVPLIVHEQNRAPGLTNRVLARLARQVLSGFPGSFPGREVVVGNPVRAEIAQLPPPAQRIRDDGELHLLLIGGSQGARALNLALPQALRTLDRRRLQVRHQCGQALQDETRRAYADAGIEASVEPFIADMAAAYGWADLVICRAGALTLAELCAAGMASVLVPLPSAADDHQTANARHLAEHGAALLLPQAQLETQLPTLLAELIADPARRLAMAESARALARPDAADRVAQIAIDCAAAMS